MPDPTPQNLISFFQGLETRYYGAYAGTPEWSDQLAYTETSTTELMLHGWMDRLPAMREWFGQRMVTEPILQSRSLVNRHFEQTSSISRNKFVDDQHGLYGNIVVEHARQAAKQHDYQIAALLETNPTCFDGSSFFSTTHKQDTSGQITTATYSNDLVNLALNPSNFGQVKTAMRNFAGRDKKPFGVYPTLVVVPTNLEEAATVIAKNEYFSPAQFGNQTQQVGMTQNIYRGTFEVLVIPELTLPKVWYAFYTLGAIKALLKQLREPINFVPLVNPNDPNVFWQREYVWGADMRSAYDVTVPWYAVRCGASL